MLMKGFLKSAFWRQQFLGCMIFNEMELLTGIDCKAWHQNLPGKWDGPDA